MPARLQAAHPVLAAREIAESLAFFRALGFAVAFVDDNDAPRYAVVTRDGVELHLQWADAGQWVAGLDRPAYRFYVDDVDALHREFDAAGAIAPISSPWRAPGDTPWGTREFHMLDPAGNVLQFYRDR